MAGIVEALGQEFDRVGVRVGIPSGPVFGFHLGQPLFGQSPDGIWSSQGRQFLQGRNGQGVIGLAEFPPPLGGEKVFLGRATPSPGPGLIAHLDIAGLGERGQVPTYRNGGDGQGIGQLGGSKRSARHQKTKEAFPRGTGSDSVVGPVSYRRMNLGPLFHNNYVV